MPAKQGNQAKKERKNKRRKARANRRVARADTTVIVSKALKELKLQGNGSSEIAKSIALPREGRPLRLPLQSTIGTRTAISNFLYAGGAVARNAETGPIEDEIASHTWVLTRSPVAPLWETVSLTTSVDTTLWNLDLIPVYTDNVVMSFRLAAYDVLTSLASHKPPLGSSTLVMTPLIYFPSGSKLQIRLINSNPSTSILINLLSFIGESRHPRESAFSITTDATGNGTNTPVSPPPGWYGLANLDLPATTVLLAGTVLSLRVVAAATKITALLPTFLPYETANAPLLYSQARLNSSSVLISNTTPQLRRGGRFIAARLPGGTVNFCDTDSFYGAVGRANPTVKYEGRGDLGCYSWTLPDQRSMEFTDYVVNYTSAILTADINDFEFFNVIMYLGGVMSDTATDKAAVQTFAVEADWTIEFCPNTQLLPLAVPRYHYSDYERAIVKLASTPPFRENPGHWAAIAKMMRALAGFAGPHLLKGLKHGAKSLAMDAMQRL